MPVGKLSRKGLLTLLAPGATLQTPPFQRAYAWGEKQINDFWKDLSRALDASGGPEDYFLGLIVIDDSNHIQDGQQRLATTLLLATEMYDAMEAAKNVGAPESDLVRDLTATISPPLRISPATLAIDAKDQDVLLGRAGIRSDSPESAKRIDAARTQLEGLLGSDLSKLPQPNPQLKRLKDWADFLEANAYVVVMEVPPRNAHNIFETLNTRGLRLSNGDLVKSHLIASTTTATDTDAAVAKWGEITNVLSDSSGRFEDDLERFLLHYYGSRYERTTNQGLFGEFRERIEGRRPLTVLNELIASARIYRALVDPAGETAFWNRIGADAQRAVELVNGLGLKQLRYLLLSVLRDLGSNQKSGPRRKKQREAILRIAAWSVRGLVHGRTGGGDAERTYILAAERIRDGRIKTVEKLKEWFDDRDMLPSDHALFEEAFRRFPFDKRTSHTSARLILRALEHAKISSRSGLIPRGTLTVEHVLPQSPKQGEWTGFTEEERAEYTFHLGNLLLIDGPSGANRKLGNREWRAKRALIQKWGTQTPLTTEAVGLPLWTKQTIEDRDSKLAKLAVQAFAV